MKRYFAPLTFSIGLLAFFVSSCQDAAQQSESELSEQESASNDYEAIKIRGKVVWIAEAMAQRHGLRPVPDATERVIGLQTDEGALHPIFEDTRGGAFRKDDRLRGIPLELLVRKFTDTPMVQVIQVISIEDDGNYELDYWCDICAIAMYELKPCECCQAEIQLRRRRLSK